MTTRTKVILSSFVHKTIPFDSLWPLERSRFCLRLKKPPQKTDHWLRVSEETLHCLAPAAANDDWWLLREASIFPRLLLITSATRRVILAIVDIATRS